MPYTIAKQGEQWCVYKKGEDGEPMGETLGCHETEDEAVAQIGAVESSEAERTAPEPEIRRSGTMNYARAYKAKEPPADGRVWYVAATEGVKRDGLDLRIADFDLKEFAAYPIILYGHDYMGRNLPIGLGEPRVVDRELHMGIDFDSADPFAMQVKGKAEKGMIAGSVGWEDIEIAGKTRHSLMEFSLVPMPADPKSLPILQARALRNMADALDRLDTGDSQPLSDGEPAWPEVATAMVAVFAPAGDDPDDARLERYNALLPKYRRLGKEAPEFLDGATVSALGPAERRGLFLAGEPDLLPLEFTEPGLSAPDSMGVMLEGIQARLTALEARVPQAPATTEVRMLESVLAKLGAIGVRVVALRKPEPSAAQGAEGGDDGRAQQHTGTATETDTILQGILEKLESRT